MAVERGRDPNSLGQPGGGGDLQRTVIHGARGPHHRSKEFCRAADRAAGRLAAAWRGATELVNGASIDEVTVLLGMRSLDRAATFIGFDWRVGL